MSTMLQRDMEKIIEGQHYKSYDDWIENFSHNLIDIWNESSAHDLIPKDTEGDSDKSSSAIIIGRGPSLLKHNHLRKLAESNFEGSILCSDGALPTVLKNGVTPDKFPDFYVVTIDPLQSIKRFYDDPLVDRYGKKIKGIFTTISHNDAVSRARKAGIKIYWMHSLFDINEGKKSFNYITSRIVRSKNHINGLPGIQTGGNVGTSAWFLAWKILKCQEVVLIGINHGWEEDDPWDVIISHNNMLPTENIDRNSTTFQKLFEKGYNPEFKCHFIYDPIFRFYSNGLKEFIARAPKWVTTINATEGGSIFGEGIICKRFSEYLEFKKN